MDKSNRMRSNAKPFTPFVRPVFVFSLARSLTVSKWLMQCGHFCLGELLSLFPMKERKPNGSKWNWLVFWYCFGLLRLRATTYQRGFRYFLPIRRVGLLLVGPNAAWNDFLQGSLTPPRNIYSNFMHNGFGYGLEITSAARAVVNRPFFPKVETNAPSGNHKFNFSVWNVA